jgi:predicted RNA-binding Zn-ribbon protein involved in translation (DUF1610 family)
MAGFLPSIETASDIGSARRNAKAGQTCCDVLRGSNRPANQTVAGRATADHRVSAAPPVYEGSVHALVGGGATAPATRHISRMAARDNWQVHLRCPTCGAVGTAEVSEDEQLRLRPTGTLRVDRMSDGFRTRTLGATMRTTEFECIRCGVLTQR